MVIAKAGLYRLLQPIGVMPAEIFVTFVKNKFANGFKVKGSTSNNYYRTEPVKLIKEINNGDQ